MKKRMRSRLLTLALAVGLCLGAVGTAEAAIAVQQPSADTSIVTGTVTSDGYIVYVLKNNGELWYYSVDRFDASKIESGCILNDVAAIAGLTNYGGIMPAVALQNDGSLWLFTLGPGVSTEKIAEGVSRIGTYESNCYLESGRDALQAFLGRERGGRCRESRLEQ